MTAREIDRRTLLAGASAAAAVAAGAARPAAAPGARRRRPRVHDVVIVGAGMAGLSAARDLRSGGRSVVVLEAQSRPGGRVRDHRSADGFAVELGGQWTGPGQDLVLGLAQEFGIATFPTYADGQSLYERGGRLQRWSGDLPPLGALATAEVAALILRLDQDAAGVPADEPWKAPRAREFDAQSITTYVESTARDPEARDLASLAIRGVFGEEPSQISALNLLAGITGCGGDFETLIGSAQSLRFEGGPEQLALGLARQIPRAIRYGEEAVAVRRTSRYVEVVTRRRAFRAREVILALPLHLIGRLRFDPDLPRGLDQFLQRTPMGSVIKANVVYDEPFWRADGLSGEVISTDGPVEIVYDNSPPDGSPGVLVAFLEADKGRALLDSSLDDRRTVILDALVRFFGPQARRPREYVDRVWAADPFAGGAYGAFTGPGVLTSLGAAGAAPLERLQIAGGDVSAVWPGYIDGAIRSGRAAAATAIGRL